MPSDALDAPTRDAVLGLCARAYGEPFEPVLEAIGPATHVLAFEGTVLVAHAAWVERWLQPGRGALLRAAYVEAVATEPAYGRRGLASLVLRELAGALDGFDIGALSPSEPGFYARLGWRSWRGPLLVRHLDGSLESVADEQAMVLSLARTPALDLDAPLSIEWRPGEIW